MTDYLQECYLAAGGADIADRIREMLAGLAVVLSEPGLPASLIGSILVPGDETLFLLWRADDEGVVRDLAERAGVACDRITEVITLPAVCQSSRTGRSL